MQFEYGEYVWRSPFRTGHTLLYFQSITTIHTSIGPGSFVSHMPTVLLV